MCFIILECVDGLKSVMQQIQNRDIEECVLDLGRALYKLHFQLLLLLESANKMFSVLCATASDNQVIFIVVS